MPASAISSNGQVIATPTKGGTKVYSFHDMNDRWEPMGNDVIPGVGAVRLSGDGQTLVVRSPAFVYSYQQRTHTWVLQNSSQWNPDDAWIYATAIDASASTLVILWGPSQGGRTYRGSVKTFQRSQHSYLLDRLTPSKKTPVSVADDSEMSTNLVTPPPTKSVPNQNIEGYRAPWVAVGSPVFLPSGTRSTIVVATPEDSQWGDFAFVVANPLAETINGTDDFMGKVWAYSWDEKTKDFVISEPVLRGESKNAMFGRSVETSGPAVTVSSNCASNGAQCHFHTFRLESRGWKKTGVFSGNMARMLQYGQELGVVATPPDSRIHWYRYNRNETWIEKSSLVYHVPENHSVVALDLQFKVPGYSTLAVGTVHNSSSGNETVGHLWVYREQNQGQTMKKIGQVLTGPSNHFKIALIAPKSPRSDQPTTLGTTLAGNGMLRMYAYDEQNQMWSIKGQDIYIGDEGTFALAGGGNAVLVNATHIYSYEMGAWVKQVLSRTKDEYAPLNPSVHNILSDRYGREGSVFVGGTWKAPYDDFPPYVIRVYNYNFDKRGQLPREVEAS